MFLLPYIVLTWRQRQLQSAATAEARVAKETFSQTLGIVCHELRNPVHALQGTLSALMDECRPLLKPQLRAEVLAAMTCAKTMQNVLDDVVEMQRHDVVSALRCGRCAVLGSLRLSPSFDRLPVQTTLTPRLSPCDLGSIVRDVANRLRNDMKPAVSFTVVSSKDLPVSELMLDQLHLRMVRTVQLHRCK